jgi:hypothetical protein
MQATTLLAMYLSGLGRGNANTNAATAGAVMRTGSQTSRKHRRKAQQ